MRLPLSVAVAQPGCVVGDVAANASAHAAAVGDARARVVIFPELSLTGYTLDAPPVDLADPVLGPLVDACGAAGSMALVGAPVAEGDGRRSIAALAVTARGAVVAYRKTCLGGAEPAWFVPGPGPRVWEVDGWRLGLGICKDTGVASHVDATAALGIDLYVAGLVHGPDELVEQDLRGVRIAARVGVPVAFASAAGPAGPDYGATAGHSTIWSERGTVLGRADARPGRTVRATLPGVP
jgi:predicted amidohydrolase